MVNFTRSILEAKKKLHRHHKLEKDQLHLTDSISLQFPSNLLSIDVLIWQFYEYFPAYHITEGKHATFTVFFKL